MLESGHFVGGFDWLSLQKGSIVADVGRGFGEMIMELMQRFKHLRYVAQDLQPVVKCATKCVKCCS